MAYQELRKKSEHFPTFPEECLMRCFVQIGLHDEMLGNIEWYLFADFPMHIKMHVSIFEALKKKKKLCIKNKLWGFPHGSVVKNPPDNAGDTVWSLILEGPMCLEATKPVCQNYGNCSRALSSAQSNRSVVSYSLRPRGLQHARPLCPPPTPGACSNSCP